MMTISHTMHEKAAAPSFFRRLRKNYTQHRTLYLIMVPILLYYVVFKYVPMFGIVIAFEDYRPGLGILGSRFVGLRHFVDFLTDSIARRTIRNTVLLNFYSLLYGFPAPILLALLLNELKAGHFKKTVQTVTYMPHFISLIVVCGILKDFTGSNGVFSDVAAFFGMERQAMLGNVALYRPIYVGSGIWQSIGWGSVLYLAALSNVDLNLYEAAVIDGAGRFQQLVHITLPSISPIIVLQLILRVGSMMSEGADKTILLYSPLVYENADIISSYVYRRGLQEMSFSYGAAVGLFNSVINLLLLTGANWLARRTTSESMW